VGFTPKSTVLKLVFDEDTPLHGLTVRAKPCTVGEWNDMLIWSAEQRKNAADVAAANDRITELFLHYVVDWDLEIPEGNPVPITLEGWRTIDNNFADLIITAWQVAMVGIPKTSKSESPAGGTSAEQQLDLESISESLPNWNPPSSS
jgi:hypothetical protein